MGKALGGSTRGRIPLEELPDEIGQRCGLSSGAAREEILFNLTDYILSSADAC